MGPCRTIYLRRGCLSETVFDNVLGVFTERAFPLLPPASDDTPRIASADRREAPDADADRHETWRPPATD
jgi:hypothetical protein